MENIKILLAEDNENQRAIYQEELEDEGYSVKSVSNGKDAIEEVKYYKPHLVILDIQMPGINGMETLDEILTLNKSLPIIFHTAYSNYKDNFLAWAANAYVVKSSDLSILKKKIKDVLIQKKIIKEG